MSFSKRLCHVSRGVAPPSTFLGRLFSFRSAYDPWGALLASSSGDSARRGFNDQEEDRETGLLNLGVRKYDEELGRFLSVDPLMAKSPSVSPYVYCSDDPVNFTDPSGMQTRPLDANRLRQDQLARAYSRMGLCDDGWLATGLGALFIGTIIRREPGTDVVQIFNRARAMPPNGDTIRLYTGDTGPFVVGPQDQSKLAGTTVAPTDWASVAGSSTTSGRPGDILCSGIRRGCHPVLTIAD